VVEVDTAVELYSLEFCSLTASNAEFSVGELFVSALVADTPEVEVVATKPDGGIVVVIVAFCEAVSLTNVTSANRAKDLVAALLCISVGQVDVVDVLALYNVDVV